MIYKWLINHMMSIWWTNNINNYLLLPALGLTLTCIPRRCLLGFSEPRLQLRAGTSMASLLLFDDFSYGSAAIKMWWHMEQCGTSCKDTAKVTPGHGIDLVSMCFNTCMSIIYIYILYNTPVYMLYTRRCLFCNPLFYWWFLDYMHGFACTCAITCSKHQDP